MSSIRQLIDERVHSKNIEEVSRLFFPGYWSLKDRAESEAEVELAEALTKHDQPCMSY